MVAWRIGLSKKIALFVLLLLWSSSTWSADCPQWRGPNRNGIYNESNLLSAWPAEGPKLLWSCDSLGKGYSSPAVVKGLVYITGKVDKNEVLYTFDLNGKLLWQKIYGQAWKNTFPEVRTTPTVDNDRIYLISGMGQVVCLDARTGAEKWQVDAVEKFKGEFPRWGMSESPLVDGDLVFCTPGGSEASVVALNKKTGETVWVAPLAGQGANYCSPILAEYAGKRLLITQLSDAVVALEAKTGRLLWQDSYSEYQKDPKDININSPVYHDGAIYVTSGYDNESALLQMNTDASAVSRTWVDSVLDVHLGGVVLVDGYLYGANWLNNRDGHWVCLDWKTGKVMYETEWMCKGSIISANGMLYCYEEKKGTLALVKASPHSFDIVSTFTVNKGSGPYWAHPVISDARLYLRHGEALLVYDIKTR